VKTLEAAGLSPRRVSDRVYFDDPDGIEVQVSAPNRPGA
jgi:catechol-2,3-dioxygenase